MNKWVSYWKKSLIDRSQMKVDYYELIQSGLIIDFNELEEGITSDKVKKLFSKDDEDSILILVSPVLIKSMTTHTHSSGEGFSPFLIPCLLDEMGDVSPPNSSSLHPWFIRDIIEPNNSNYPNIANVEILDRILDNYSFKDSDNISEYFNKCSEFFEEITGATYSNFSIENYYTNYEPRVVKSNDKHATVRSIIDGFKFLENHGGNLPLFEKISCDSQPEIKATPEVELLFAESNHIAQMSKDFPLSNSQRISCNLFLNSEYSEEILAINGPPGTGKTTLLQTIVANNIVQAIIDGKESVPLTIATSNNNQAIKNILKSFKNTSGGNLLTSRWLPKIKSLGLYFVSKKKEGEAKKEGYPCVVNDENSIFNELESSEFLYNAKKYFLTQSNNYLSKDSTNLNFTVQLLKNEVMSNIKKQREIIELSKKYKKCISLKEDVKRLNNKIHKLEIMKNKLKNVDYRFEENLKNKTLFKKIFFFVPSIKRERHLLNMELFDGLEVNGVKFSNDTGLKKFLVNALIHNNEEMNKIRKKYSEVKEKSQEQENVISKYHEIKYELDRLAQQQMDDLIIETGTEYTDVGLLEEINVKLDLTYRSNAFNLALHYWEGRYLQELQQLLNREYREGNSEAEYRAKLERWAMIYPCFISTAYKLPTIAYKRSWEKPLFELFDLLIVDEAGQISTEVGSLAFAYAKRAIVVGDTKQIEPIWEITDKIDQGNLKLLNMIDNIDVYANLEKKGLLASNGSIMKISQRASCLSDNSIRGYSLKEHRRCLDEIIFFCEKYVYNGTIIPKVGSKSEECIKNFPSIGYMNVNGFSKKRNGSNYNDIEARTISLWIKNYLKMLEKHYQKSIGEIIGILTPFKAQKDQIINQLKACGLDSKGITVGTIHALQGAERNIIIFSPVYSNSTSDFFFDKKVNMLNVVVSRAKHNFFVFGNMRIFNPVSNTPSGNLAKVLFSSVENELGEFFVSISSELNKYPLKFPRHRLADIHRHREAIKYYISTAKERVIIVSPYISIHAINEDGIISICKDAIRKGVSITVITDKYLDLDSDNELKPNSKKGRVALQKIGVKLLIVDRIHQKTLLRDDDTLIEGSFNWLSAVRNENSKYSRKEVSYIITEKVDPNLHEYIKSFEEDLNTMLTVTNT